VIAAVQEFYFGFLGKDCPVEDYGNGFIGYFTYSFTYYLKGSTRAVFEPYSVG
jgi:hypothetical protein